MTAGAGSEIGGDEQSDVAESHGDAASDSGTDDALGEPAGDSAWETAPNTAAVETTAADDAPGETLGGGGETTADMAADEADDTLGEPTRDDGTGDAPLAGEAAAADDALGEPVRSESTAPDPAGRETAAADDVLGEPVRPDGATETVPAQEAAAADGALGEPLGNNAETKQNTIGRANETAGDLVDKPSRADAAEPAAEQQPALAAARASETIASEGPKSMDTLVAAHELAAMGDNAAQEVETALKPGELQADVAAKAGLAPDSPHVVVPDVASLTTPVRTDTLEHATADMALNARRIEGAVADAAGQSAGVKAHADAAAEGTKQFEEAKAQQETQFAQAKADQARAHTEATAAATKHFEDTKTQREAQLAQTQADQAKAAEDAKAEQQKSFETAAAAATGHNTGTLEQGLKFYLGEHITDEGDSNYERRGWTLDSIRDAVDNSVETHRATDHRYNKVTGEHNSDPATAYVNADGEAVTVNDLTGDVVQVSDQYNPDWKHEHEKEQK